MKKIKEIVVVLGVVSLLSVGLSAQVKKGKTRVLTTKQMMSGLVKPNCSGISEGLKTAPSDQKGGDELVTKAALLNESSFTMMDDGRCPDGEWAAAATTLREGSAAVLAKIEAKDAAGALEAFKTVTGSCASCHKAHKKSAASKKLKNEGSAIDAPLVFDFAINQILSLTRCRCRKCDATERYQPMSFDNSC